MMRLAEAVRATGGRLVGADVDLSGVTTDSRKVAPGDLFIALRGDTFDGHDFVRECAAQGAVAVMVGRTDENFGALPQCVVDDTRLGLGRLSAEWRRRHPVPLVAITGSNGKTTVKEMLAAILRRKAGENAVLATAGNLNNDIGLPLTLLRLNSAHRYAVTEMGMNHPGEIDYMTRLAKPEVALVNNAGAAHLEGLGNVEAVARAKGEIFAGLAETGVAIINADDPHAELWRSLAAPHEVIAFGVEQPADVTADYRLFADGVEFTLRTPVGQANSRIAAPGLHNLKNALAAAAAATALRIPLSDIAAGLETFGGVKGRLQPKAGCCGARLIDDTYNANPASMRAAIGVLAALPGKRMFVMGDMGELGANALALHREVGDETRAAGIERLFTLGEMSAAAAEAFGVGATHAGSVEELAGQVRKEMAPGTTVLVKGSRFMRMERVVEALGEKEEASCC